MEYKTLGEIVDFVDGDRGKNYPKGNEFFDNGYCLFLDTSNVTKDGLNLSSVHFISKEKDEKLRNGKIQKNEIVITTRGTIGNSILSNNLLSQYPISRINSSMLILRKKSFAAININYLYYLFKSSYFQKCLMSFASGSAQPQLPVKDLKNIKIPIISMKQQNNLISILSAYDDLIENNNKRIKLLEKMAENLYKEWFVRFRFPNFQNTKKESPLGKIPDSFDVVKISTLIDYYIGGGWGADDPNNQFCEEAYVVRGTDFPHVKIGKLDTCPFRYHKTSNYAVRKLKTNDIVIEVSGGTQEQPVGRSVLITQKQLDRLGNRLICASFCKQIRCNTDKITPRYLYHWLQYMYETRMVDKYQLQSTGIINFQFEYFMRKCNVLLPPYELMKKFSNIVEIYYSEIDNIAQQNANLIKQRDFLLPRLMSGKLDVAMANKEPVKTHKRV